jgi:hypothetical protein
MRDIAIWRNELIDELRTIGNRKELEQLWSETGPNATAISSYPEEVEHVFSDFDIDGFLSLDLKQSGLTPSQSLALHQFRDEFSKFVDYTNREHHGMPDYRTVLADPRWARIMALAKEFITLIDEGK